MRVLVASSYYAPEVAGNAPYVTGVCEGLAERGHEVVVAAGFPHYPWWRLQERALGRTDRIGGVTVRRRIHYVPRRSTLLRRALYEASLSMAGLAALPGRRPDAIVAIVPSLADAMVARAASLLYRRPYGIVFQDLMGVAATEVGASGSTGAGGAIAAVERAAARDAAAVAVVADGYAAYLVDGGVAPDRIHRVYNWAEYAAPRDRRADVRARLGWRDDEVVCLYAGNLGYKQGLETVVDAAGSFNGEPLRLVLAGEGNERESLRRRAALAGRVEFLPASAPGEYESLLEAADVLVLCQRAAVAEMSVASKLGPYLRAGKPIAAALSPESETALELGRSGAGVIVEPERPAALADVLRRLAVQPALRISLGERGAAYSKAHLRRDRAVDGYERLLDRIRAGVPRARAEGRR